LHDQPRLTDTGLAAYTERDGIAGLCRLEGGMQTAELNYTTNELRGREGPRHGDEYAPYGSRWELADVAVIIHSAANGGREMWPARSVGGIARHKSQRSAKLSVVTGHKMRHITTAGGTRIVVAPGGRDREHADTKKRQMSSENH
jgi:hypothetical protein